MAKVPTANRGSNPRRLAGRFIAGAGVLLGAAGAAEAVENLEAKILAEAGADFRANCTGCHGADGRGQEARESRADWPPRDLTMLAKWNSGIFPFWTVFRIVGGEKLVAGHDSPLMPDFSSRSVVYVRKPGMQDAHVRVLELTHYLQSIQR